MVRDCRLASDRFNSSGLLRRLAFKIPPHEVKRYGLAIMGGLLLAAAYPTVGVAGFAWIAPGLMLAAAMGTRGGQVFRIGLMGGFAFYLGALSWLLRIPLHFTPIIGWLVLSAYLAIYPALWVWLSWKLFLWNVREPESSVLPTSALLGRGALLETLDWFLCRTWLQRLAWSLLCAALWVALEMIVGRLFTGFPWLYLGVSQYRLLPLIQIASITGVYGVSFLPVWFSVSLVSAFAVLLRRPQVRWHGQREILLPFMVAVGVIAAGWSVIMRSTPPQPKLKAALIQPSIPQTWIWDPKESSNRFQQLLQLSEQALTNHPDLLVWPEAAVPYMYRFDEEIHTAVTNLVQTHKVWLILGSDDGEVRIRPNGRMETNFFNSSFLVSPEGETKGVYRKRRLVIFGEYIPFGRDFTFIEGLTGMGSFTPGDRAVNFFMPDLHAKAAMLICFEDVFPDVTRASVEDDTDFILNLTNNGWFGESAAQWQHAANAVFRAVENGRPLVRSTNNGLTCWVDPQGRMDQIFFPGTKDIYGMGFKIVDIPLLGGGKPSETFYHRHGDWFGWGCVSLSALAVLLQIALPRRARHAEQTQQAQQV